MRRQEFWPFNVGEPSSGRSQKGRLDEFDSLPRAILVKLPPWNWALTVLLSSFQ